MKDFFTGRIIVAILAVLVFTSAVVFWPSLQAQLLFSETSSAFPDQLQKLVSVVSTQFKVTITNPESFFLNESELYDSISTHQVIDLAGLKALLFPYAKTLDPALSIPLLRNYLNQKLTVAAGLSPPPLIKVLTEMLSAFQFTLSEAERASLIKVLPEIIHTEQQLFPVPGKRLDLSMLLLKIKSAAGNDNLDLDRLRSLAVDIFGRTIVMTPFLNDVMNILANHQYASNNFRTTERAATGQNLLEALIKQF